MNTILIIKCLALSLLPVGIDAAVSWKDLTKMRKGADYYIVKEEAKNSKKELKLSRKEKAMIKKFLTK